MSPLSETSEQVDILVAAGAARLLARASDTHALDVSQLKPRIRSAVEKYLLKDDPHAAPDAISEFIDGLQADDLCLIVACEHGAESAWSDLVARFTTTVRSKGIPWLGSFTSSSSVVLWSLFSTFSSAG